jgi:hypothetical protein
MVFTPQMEGGTLTLTNTYTETNVVATTVAVTFLSKVPTPFPGLAPRPAL